MSAKGEPGKVASVRFERLLPGPIERVWDFLTKADLLPSWFGEGGTIEARVGGAVNLMDGHIRGTVTQCRPPHLLSYTWNVFGPGRRVSYPESYLTLSLEKRGDQVLLTLTHLPILERFEKQNAMGWHTFLDILEDGRPARPRGDYMKTNAELYGVDLHNIAR